MIIRYTGYTLQPCRAYYHWGGNKNVQEAALYTGGRGRETFYYFYGALALLKEIWWSVQPTKSMGQCAEPQQGAAPGERPHRIFLAMSYLYVGESPIGFSIHYAEK